MIPKFPFRLKLAKSDKGKCHACSKLIKKGSPKLTFMGKYKEYPKERHLCPKCSIEVLRNWETKSAEMVYAFVNDMLKG